MNKKILLGLMAVSLSSLSFTSCSDDDEGNSTFKNAELVGSTYVNSSTQTSIHFQNSNQCVVLPITLINDTLGTVKQDSLPGTYFFDGTQLVLSTNTVALDEFGALVVTSNAVLYSDAAISGNTIIYKPYELFSLSSTGSALVLTSNSDNTETITLNGATNMLTDASGTYALDFTKTNMLIEGLSCTPTPYVASGKKMYKMESAGGYSYKPVLNADGSLNSATLLISDVANGKAIVYSITCPSSNTYRVSTQNMQLVKK